MQFVVEVSDLFIHMRDYKNQDSHIHLRIKDLFRLLAVLRRYRQPPGKQFRQSLLLDRFGNEIAHSGLNALISITSHGKGSHGYDGNLWVEGL